MFLFLQAGIRTGDQVLVSNQFDRGQILVSNRSEDDVNCWKFPKVWVLVTDRSQHARIQTARG